MSEPDAYDQYLADWKRKQGLPEHALAAPDDETLMAAEDAKDPGGIPRLGPIDLPYDNRPGLIRLQFIPALQGCSREMKGVVSIHFIWDRIVFVLEGVSSQNRQEVWALDQIPSRFEHLNLLFDWKLLEDRSDLVGHLFAQGLCLAFYIISTLEDRIQRESESLSSFLPNRFEQFATNNRSVFRVLLPDSFCRLIRVAH